MVTSRLNVKLLRDIKASPWLFTGIVIIVAAGIALFQAAYASYLNLGGSYQLSYKKLNMADFTIDVRSAPEEVVQRLRKIPGIHSVEGRVIEEIELQLEPRDSEKVVGQIVSVPDRGYPGVNTLLLTQGALPRSTSSRSLVLESAFAKYHKYHTGDLIYPVVQGDDLKFRITGITKSPEYIMVVRGREYPLPSPRQFGVMFMRKSEVDRLFGTSGEINQVVATVEAGASRDRIMRLAYNVMKPYGADDPVPREDQASYELLEMDLRALRNLAVFFPLMFLSIASLSIYNLLTRMIHSQRNQIGFMRAIGYPASAVYTHYLMFASMIGVLGSIIGGFLGYYMAGVVTHAYTSNLEVPFYDIGPRWDIILSGAAVVFIVTTISGLVPSMAAAKLPPAEAIRTEIVAGGRVPIIERWLPTLGRASYMWRLPIRNVFRSPKRSLSAVAGVVSAVILIFVSGGLLDSSIQTIDFYFDAVQRYDAYVSFLHPQEQFVTERIKRWKGVSIVEPVLMLPAKIEKRQYSEMSLIYGLVPGTRLLRLQSESGGPVAIPEEGILIGQATAQRMNVGIGRQLRLTLPKKTTAETAEIAEIPVIAGSVPQLASTYSYRQSILSRGGGGLETQLDTRVRIAGVTYQPVGNAIATSIFNLRRIYGKALELPPDAVTGAMVKVDKRYLNEVEDKLFDLPGVASVDVASYTREEINEMLKAFYTFVYVMLGFSIALAGIIIFNATIMSVIERSREISSLRTLGTPRWMIAVMITIENLIYWVVGMIIGFPVGRQFSAFFVKLYQSDTFNMRPTISDRTILWTIFGILAVVILAQIPAIRYVNRLDLAKSAKEIG